MRTLLAVLLLVSPLILFVPSVSAGSDGCVLVDAWPLPEEVDGPVTCMFLCEPSTEGRIAMTLEATDGHIEAACGGIEGGFYTGPTPLCAGTGPVQAVDGCTGAVGRGFDHADTGTCTFYPAEGERTFVYTARCTATWE